MGVKIAIEKALNFLEEKHGKNISMIEYDAMNSDAIFHCNVCGNEWKTMARIVIMHGSNCPKCSKRLVMEKSRHSNEYINNYIESFGCKWVSGKYETTKYSRLLIEFPCGHSQEKTFDSFQQGNRCSICSLEKRKRNQLTKEADIIAAVKNFGFNFLGFPDGYTGNQSYIEYECQKKHITKRKWVNFQKDSNCKICALQKRSEGSEEKTESVNNFIISKNCNWISGEYKTKQSILTIEFECGHRQEIPYYLFYLKKNYLCYECSSKADSLRMRKPIEDIMRLLEDNGLIFGEFIEGYKNNVTKISYFCKEHRHKTIRTLAYVYKKTYCAECFKQEVRSWYCGDKNPAWKGGITGITDYMRSVISDWRRESIARCDRKCVITGLSYDVVHHLYGFRLIAEKVFRENNFPLRESMFDYSEEELKKIKDAVVFEHNKLYGVCLTTKVHKLFHKLYGSGNNTPEQFEEFKQRIKSGDIIIPD